MDPTNDNENNASSISSDLIRGHINTIILRTLYDGDKYGYEIINEIEEKSKGQYSLKQPTLYSALKRLESQDYVTSYWGGVSNGGRRKYFQITDKGKKIVEQNLAEWEYSRTVIDSLISEKDYDFNNPPPSAVDFSLLRKSTTRVPRAGGVGHDEIELGTYENDSADEAGQTRTAEQDVYTAAEEPQSSENELDTLLASLDNSDDASQADTVNEISQSSEPEKLRFDDTVIYENLPYPAESKQEVVDGAALKSAASSEEETPVGETTGRTNAEVRPAAENAVSSDSYSERVQDTVRVEHDTWIDEEQRRIQHENYKNLVGDEDDATSYYYAQIARQNRSEQEQPVQMTEPAYDEPVYEQAAAPQQRDASVQPPPQDDYDDPYLENRAISSELLYSNRSPAERNYKDLLSRLYDNSHPVHEDPMSAQNDYYPEEPAENAVYSQQADDYGYDTANEPYQNAEQFSAPPQGQSAYTSAQYAEAAPASNVEFYDIQERAENDGIRITTSNGAKNRTAAKTVGGNTFDKGKALFLSALFVFIIALAECIVNLCIRNAIDAHPAYIIVPFVCTFLMFGIFLFLYLRGYGRNSRKTQSRSYISASLILFVNLLVVICLIAYFIISSGTGVSFIQVLKYAILPCIFVFNIPLFAIFYNYNSNKQ